DYKAEGPLAGFGFQEDIERRAFSAGGGDWTVPAQNLEDFLSAKMSGRLNKNSCRTGTAPADLRQILPGFVSDELLTAFSEFKKGYPSFVSGEAVLLAPETRTSCPVKVLRDDNCESSNIGNLYPIGEGAGYAGGITSSAIDAIKAVECSLRHRG
ncbi:MAG TPA: dehydrogenase, partial [Elusimicrobia bacterium]|nr:dehydrogenase [Elusimicrobiota bacterium]